MKFKKVKLSEIAQVNMGMSPKSEYYNKNKLGTPFLQGIKTFGRLFPSYDTYTEKVTKLAKKGDVLFSVRAPVGEVNISTDKICIGRGLSSISGNNNKFLYYLLKNKKNEIQSYTTGTVFSSINKKNIENLEFIVPESEKYSDVITRFLWNLDSKIEVNKQIIENLEETAEAIFKHWFVDFEFPDENGKPYKSSGGKMVESELGQIPEGWEIKKLGELFEFKRKSFNPKKNRNLEILHFSIPAYDEKIYPVRENTNDIKSNKYLIGMFSVLISKLNPNVQRVWLPNFNDKFINICSTEFMVIDANSRSQQGFVYFLIKSKDYYNFLNKNKTGSTNSRQRVSPSIAENYKIPFNIEIMEKFGKMIQNNILKITNLREQNQKLEDLRDTLLPKLLSGEIEVPMD